MPVLDILESPKNPAASWFPECEFDRLTLFQFRQYDGDGLQQFRHVVHQHNFPETFL